MNYGKCEKEHNLNCYDLYLINDYTDINTTCSCLLATLGNSEEIDFSIYK